MTKTDLIAALARKEQITEKQAAGIINLLFASFTQTFQKDDRIEIRGFGSFTVRQYETYMGRNPKTGQNVAVRQKKLPFFKPGKELKEMVDR